MDFRRITASVAVTALLLGATAAPVMAKNGNGNAIGHFRISQQFQDMGGFEWGLSDVVRMQAFGIFKGRGASEFAPGAKITNQESAVAIARLMGKEGDSLKLSTDEINLQLKAIPDQGSIASWARPAVAIMVKEGVIPSDAAFAPLKDATRLQIAVRLVKALGYDAEAQAKMNVALPFKDASTIPADKVGYVAVAVTHKLVTGYAEDNTFRPSQPVRRVEMAVMMGRADNQIDRRQHEEMKGVVKSIDAANSAFTFTNKDGQDATVKLADDASIFVDGTEKDLSALVAGMNVVVKLDADGKVEFVNAKTPDATPDQGLTGSLSAITPASATSLGLITVNSTVYPVAASATITLNGAASTLASLQVGDQVKLTVATGLVTKVEATRQVAPVVVNGSISAITVATSTAPGALTINGTVYPIPATAAITVNGATAAFADLQVGDTAAVTLANNVVTKVDVTRAIPVVVNGAISAITPATASAPAALTVNNNAYSIPATAAITVNGVTATFADLQVGDTAAITLVNNVVTKIDVTRNQTVINGSIVSLVPAAAATDTTAAVAAQIGISYVQNGSVSMSTYPVQSTTQILVNGTAAQFTDLHLGDTVKVTLVSNNLVKVEVTR